ncbi:Cch1 protein [Saccharomycopsis crataegensis]|uniref:Calcium-channel protein CCH1 n=1 Tax=Saccharomycopsis crataegensis TaxID=43959 RepID=A0AAV5QND1_9ASCO|nr:Cch1 protein [Saccharomycopsis crataegensis]
MSYNQSQRSSYQASRSSDEDPQFLTSDDNQDVVNPFEDSSSQIHARGRPFSLGNNGISRLPQLIIENHSSLPQNENQLDYDEPQSARSFDQDDDQESRFAYVNYPVASNLDTNNNKTDNSDGLNINRHDSLLVDLVDDNRVLKEALGTKSSAGLWLPLNKGSITQPREKSLHIGIPHSPGPQMVVEDFDNDSIDDQPRGGIKLQNLPIKASKDDPSLEYLSPRYPSHFRASTSEASFTSNLEDGVLPPNYYLNTSSQSVNSGNSELKRRLTTAVSKFSSRIVHGEDTDLSTRRLSQINNPSNISILNDENGDGDLRKEPENEIESPIEQPNGDTSFYSLPEDRNDSRPTLVTETISIPQMYDIQPQKPNFIPVTSEITSISAQASRNYDMDPDDSLFLRDPSSSTYNKNLGLYGHSLMIFGPYNALRVSIAKTLEVIPAFFFLIIYIVHAVVLAYQSWNPPITNTYFYTRKFESVDLIILVINVIFTLEISAKIISFGLYDDSGFYKEFNLEKKESTLDKLIKKIKFLFQSKNTIVQEEIQEAKLKHSFTLRSHVILSKSDIENLKDPFLRNNWNVIDLISCVGFWIFFLLTVANADTSNELLIFHTISCWRIFRLTRLTEGTFTIIRSLRHAFPQLANICLFIIYFWVILSIAGVQTFKSSLSRQCVYTDISDPSNSYNSLDNFQFCGGWLDADTGDPKPYLYADGSSSKYTKGFYCPRYSRCIVGDNPYNGTVSFDNFLHSLELVYVVMSMNTFTDLMYYTMDAENMAASIFFIVSIFIMSIWLMNIFVAVIVSSFKITSEMDGPKQDRKKTGGFLNFWFNTDLRNKGMPYNITSKLQKYYHFEIVWVTVIVVDIVAQSFRSANASARKINVINNIEMGVTYVLFFEIIMRFIVFLPHWRHFFCFKKNQFDLFLAIVTSVIVVPPIRESLGQVYNWLTIFQLARFYRVVASARLVRDLWLDVIGNVKTIFNMTLFYFLSLFLYSIITSFYFEGVIDNATMQDQGYQFALNTLPNTFLGLYVITSTENWTQILYIIQGYGPSSFSRAFGAIILIGWFIFSNSILLNIFIAVIAENLEVGENEKKRHQVRTFIRSLAADLYKKEEDFLDNLKKGLRWKGNGNNNNLKKKQAADVNQLFGLLMSGTLVDSFLEDEVKQTELAGKQRQNSAQQQFIFNNIVWKKAMAFWERSTRFYTDNPFYAKRQEDIENSINPNVLAKNILMEDKIMAARQRTYLEKNPSFNMVLYVFAPENRLRRFCQMFVNPAVGERIGGRPPEKRLREIFNAIMLIGTVCIVVLACYATPLYTHAHNTSDKTWFWTLYSDLAFALLFLIEAIIKIIADGFIYTPNAMLRSSWNVLDLLVLVTLWLNLILSVRGIGDSSRIVRGFKALRALRLLTISSTAKKTFHRIIIAGFGKILGAAAVSFCLLLPFSIWGLNIFNGRLSSCNDSVSTQAQCYGEYSNQVFNWDVVSPRVYEPPYLYFDSFPHSFSSLFQVSSLEGWVDLLGYVTQSTGIGTPPSLYAQPYNAIFIVVYMFLAMIFILNLFVSVIISNYARTSGNAYLTSEQKSWNEVEKLLRQVTPSIRPKKELLGPFKLAVYNLVIDKNKFWQLTYDIFLAIQLAMLLMEDSKNSVALELFRQVMFLVTATFFFTNSALRQYVKGFPDFKNRWDAFQLFVSGFAGVFQIIVLSTFETKTNIISNISKAFCLLILIFIIQRSNRLSLLLRFASASVPSLLSLLFTWFVLFLAYAIALNQIFGMAKIGSSGSGNMNVRTVTKSLLLLFKMSFGEGWNDIMNDYYVDAPYCTTTDEYSDCGNIVYAHILFISWNVISMFIFLNLFISLVVENFSYVYHRTGPCSLITRQEIRKFKQVWMKFDPDATGFIRPGDFYVFLHSLNGVLSFKLYDGRLSIKNLSENWFTKAEEYTSDGREDPYAWDIDFRAMATTLDSIDVKKVRHRKVQFERFVEEAIYDMEINGYPGISFTKVLRQIPLYTQFQDGACLSLKKFLERHLLLNELDKRIAKKKRYYARKTFIERWRFLRYWNAKRAREKENI